MIIICNPQTYSTINIHLARVDSVQLCRNENFSLPTFIFRGSSESFISILHELNTSLFEIKIDVADFTPPFLQNYLN